MQLDEIQDSITVRRNRIFLLMEEVRLTTTLPSGDKARADAAHAAGAPPAHPAAGEDGGHHGGGHDEAGVQVRAAAAAAAGALPRRTHCWIHTAPAAALTAHRLRSQTETSIKDYYIAFTILVLALIFFGGYIAPMAEVKLGLGCVHIRLYRSSVPPLNHATRRGTSYAEWVTSVGLPKQLSEVRFRCANAACTRRLRGLASG